MSMKTFEQINNQGIRLIHQVKEDIVIKKRKFRGMIYICDALDYVAEKWNNSLLKHNKEIRNKFDRNGYQVLMRSFDNLNPKVTIIEPSGEGEDFDTFEDAYNYYFGFC